VQTDRTIPNNKLNIITHDNKKRTHLLIDIAISAARNVIKNEAGKISKYKDLNNTNTTYAECKIKSDTSNNRGKWNHLKIIQKI
jgi:hypothetical protein